MQLFPAVLIGGPPHSGKSVLTYALTRILREATIEHYVLRAYPDGEGDWSYQSLPETVRAIRVKGTGDPRWIDRICRDVMNRQVPLLVDVGGKPEPWQEAVFDCCTHAVLLATDDETMRQWQTLARRHNLTILAELTSQLTGDQTISQTSPILRGTITNLIRERAILAPGSLTDALLKQLCALLYYPPDELTRYHRSTAPVETTLDLFRLAATLGSADNIWQTHQLADLLEYLPAGIALAAYNRAPTWVYAALALLSLPTPFYQFDARLGWVASPQLATGQPTPDSLLTVTVSTAADYHHFACRIPADYLDYSDAGKLILPPAPANTGLILSGKLPNWLYTALTRLYQPTVPWLAIYQPQLQGAVVIYTTQPDHPIGQKIYNG